MNEEVQEILDETSTKNLQIFESLIGVVLVAEGARPAALMDIDNDSPEWLTFLKYYQTLKKIYKNLSDFFWGKKTFLVYRKGSDVENDIKSRGEIRFDDGRMYFTNPDGSEGYLYDFLGGYLGFQCADHDLFNNRVDRFFIQYFISSKNTREEIHIYGENCDMTVLGVCDSLGKVYEDVKKFNEVLRKYGYPVNFKIFSRLVGTLTEEELEDD